MNPPDPQPSPLEERLLSERPQLDGIQLDRLWQRIQRRVHERPDRHRSRLLRGRLALTSLLAAGLLMSSTGAAVAITGIAGDNSASVSQYGTPEDGGGGVLGEQDQGNAGGGSNPAGAQGKRQAGTTPTSDVVTPRASAQVAASSGKSLPFTGFVVFPLLAGGAALVASGLLLRRRTTLRE